VDEVTPEKNIQLQSALHNWNIHTEQGQYHDWRDSSSGGVATREGFVSRLNLPLNSWGNHAKRGDAESCRLRICVEAATEGDLVPGFSAVIFMR
jgi:hypothetical protein